MRKIILPALIIITMTTPAHASVLLRSLYQNYLTAVETLKDIEQDYEAVKDARDASRDKVRSIKARYNKAKKDELKEDQQLRALITASKRKTTTPNYYLETGTGGAKLLDTARDYF